MAAPPFCRQTTCVKKQGWIVSGVRKGLSLVGFVSRYRRGPSGPPEEPGCLVGRGRPSTSGCRARDRSPGLFGRREDQLQPPGLNPHPLHRQRLDVKPH